MNRTTLAATLLAIATGAVCGACAVEACPFCPAQEATLSERVANAEAVVLAEWLSAVEPTKTNPGSTTFRAIEVLKGRPELLKTLKKVDQYRNAKEGERFLLPGLTLDKGAPLEWGFPLEINDAAYRYLRGAPAIDAPAGERLLYFAKFLENPDPLIANDAFAEFALADYAAVATIADKLPRDKLREWLASPKTVQIRIGLYGMLLGVCGDDSDGRRMEAKILEASPDENPRLGIDGIMGGYLLLTGERGLDLIDREKLKNKAAPFSETLSAVQAVRFMWSYGQGKIKPERLCDSMRLLLDRPEIAEHIVADLSRWQDWSVQDRLFGLYGVGEYDYPGMKNVILGYLFASSRDQGETAEDQARADRAREQLREIRRKNPQVAVDFKRYFIDLNP